MILDLEGDFRLAGRGRAETDLAALLRKLDRIADQIAQSLQDALAVHPYIDRLRVDTESEACAGGAGSFRNQWRAATGQYIPFFLVQWQIAAARCARSRQCH